MPGASSFLGMDQSARKDELMIRVSTALIIASAGLWLALPAAAQFEIDPDHFDEPATTVVRPRPKQSRASLRISLRHKQVQRHPVQAFIGTKKVHRTRWGSSRTISCHKAMACSVFTKYDGQS